MSVSSLVAGASSRRSFSAIAYPAPKRHAFAGRPQQSMVLALSSSTLTTRGLEAILRASGDRFSVTQAESAVEAFILSESVSAAIVLVDSQSLPPFDVAALCAELKNSHPSAGIILLAPHSDRALIRDCVAAGALCCICPDSDEFSILTAFSSAENNTRYFDPRIALGEPLYEKASPLSKLSAREREVHFLLTEGHSNRSISEKLVITEATVKGHVSSILAKLEVTSRLAAALTPLTSDA